jgi:nucleotide-binding universal stress UspA family protein
MIKDILLIVENSTFANPAVRAAVKIAEQLCADLTIEVLTATPILIPALAPMTTIYPPDAALAGDETARIKKISDMIAGSTSVIRILGMRDDPFALARRAGRAGPIADLVLMGGENCWETDWLRRRTSETIIMGAGCPLLTLREGTTLPSINCAIFGWKDSPVARRALHDLLSLTVAGANVLVVTVDGTIEDGSPIAEGAHEVVRYLVRHGLRAEWKQVDRDDLSDAETLEAFALDVGADLLAIGAFGHSRLREVVFGGVTRALIDRHRLPILFSR